MYERRSITAKTSIAIKPHAITSLRRSWSVAQILPIYNSL